MNKWAAIIFIYGVLVFHGQAGVNKNVAGPYDIVFRRIEHCEGQENDEFPYTYKLKKPNRTAIALDVDIAVTSQVDDSYKVVVDVEQWANNAWKANYLTKDLDHVCSSAMAFVPDIMRRIFKVIHVKSCPIPAANYSVKNFVLATEIKLVPVFFYNKYKAKLSIINAAKRRKLCLVIFADVVPKQGGKG